MAVALSSPGVAFHLHSPALSSSSGVSANRFLFQNQNASPSLLSLPTRRPSRSVFLFARRKNRKGFVSSSSPKKNKKVRTFAEDLNNDKSSIDDEEISEEDLDRLAAELAEVLGGGDDVDGIDLFGSIKNLAAELCLDRAYVLELLRDPPPKLLMLSATLPDEKPPRAAPENSSNPLESSAAEDAAAVEVEPEEKVKDEAVHVMQQRWSAQKRVKKAHIETLEKVYRRSKRPTNAVVSSIVQVTNLPRRRVLKWFEDRRAEDGVPEKRAPYQAPV
ncbi:Protein OVEREXPRESSOR OF CATIONIC PEROXIDASE 3 [Raphanus sativus]|nr:Protein OVEREXPRESSOR OF CATIONIC PEROXIDASE 3 [Raphanus sativus]